MLSRIRSNLIYDTVKRDIDEINILTEYSVQYKWIIKSIKSRLISQAKLIL